MLKTRAHSVAEVGLQTEASGEVDGSSCLCNLYPLLLYFQAVHSGPKVACGL